MKINGAVIIVTGASSGIGLACAKLLRQQGATVFSLSRHCQSAQVEPNGFTLPCDVTNHDSVAAAVSAVTERCGRIDGLVNCAGMGIAGAVEDTSDEEMHSQLECNFFGTVRMINAVLPVMRAQHSGTIVNISSVGGVFGIPYQAFYSAGKYAVEGMSEALRNETRQFNIKVCCVLPGDTKTGFTAARRYTAASKQKTVYNKEFCTALASMSRDECKGVPPEKVAAVVLKGLKAQSPAPRLVVGGTYKLLCFARRLLPNRLVSYALYKMYCTGAQANEYWSYDGSVRGK